MPTPSPGSDPVVNSDRRKPYGLRRPLIPPVRLFATQPDQVGAQTGQRIALGHLAGSDMPGLAPALRPRTEVHVTMAARASLVPPEAVGLARGDQQEAAGRER